VNRWRTLIRTTAFKIVAAYFLLFVVFAGFLMGWVGLATQRIFTDQIAETIEAEVRGLAEQYRQGGVRRLVAVIDQRTRTPGSSLYLVATFSGETLVGNVADLEPGTLARQGLSETEYRRGTGVDEPVHRALVQVYVMPGGFRLLVGRDLEDRDRVRQIFGRGFRLSLLVALILAVIGAYFVTRRVLARVDAMTATSQRIMTGDLTGRLPVAGTNDELDRLAESVNTMLGRIEGLMNGLKEVSDNIAHDLKTPLTRLRNRADDALRSATGDEAHKAALTSIIEESDGLIRTFNALLMIARAEAGGQRAAMGPIDLGDIASGIGELYEPLAEEAGITLTLSVKPVTVQGNRELLSQVVANLVDNAIKHGHVEGAPGTVEVAVSEAAGEAIISVADQGPGIPEADRGRVLDRFVRLEASRTRPGSGLGLSLAAAVAKLHGGSLMLQDNGPGLRAVLRLPLGNGSGDGIGFGTISG
jgi:signal transduction histidine kinase